MQLTIVSDTRQQAGKHNWKEDWFKAKGIKVVRSKLPAGDYSLLTDMSRVVDTKRNLQELVGNLTSTRNVMTKDGEIKKLSEHERFRREADFCKENGIKLIVLVEELGMRSIEDVLRWRNPRLRRYEKVKWMHQQGKWSGVPLRGKPPTSNETLYRIMKTFGENHSVKWEFCDPQDAGAKVIEILTRGKQ